MQNEGKIDNRKTMITCLFHDFSAYANMDCKMNQSEHGLSFTVVYSWFNSPNLGG